MSEPTPCNFCSLRRMRHRASRRGTWVVVARVERPDPMAGWVSARYADADEPAAYFMELSERCSC